MNSSRWTRRQFVGASVAMGIAPTHTIASEEHQMIRKSIPNSGEPLPIIGLGTYQVFDASDSSTEIELRREIVDRLTASGGSLLDSSPMYNRAERMIGDVVEHRQNRDDLFLATKVWTTGRDSGREQMQRSADLMQTGVVDLMQVHNLRDTAVHMESIRELKDSGRVRYSGLTHYTAGGHANLIREMQQFKPDFIQINYSLGEREAENSVLPTARDLGVAVLINRPFQAGRLFSAVAGKTVPDWAETFAKSWGQFFLKFIVSHPAVTCVIPATSKAHHMIDNLGAGMGELPNSEMRQLMTKFFSEL
jgi:diketogulonate reductase-like aldo/keto reductase